MFLPKAFLSLFLVGSTAVDASPSLLSRGTGKALSMVPTIKQGGTLGVADKDRARAHALQNTGPERRRSISFSITDSPGAMSYSAQVSVGNPDKATSYTLEIDTRTANTWIGASQPYYQTKTSKDTGNNISLSYNGYGFMGMMWIDTIILGSTLVVNNQTIGVVIPSSGISKLQIDGVLGLGPSGLTAGTNINSTDTIATVLDNLLSQGIISKKIFGLYYVPASESISTGLLSLDGYDDSVITSAVKYVSITHTSPASQYWGVDQSISYGDTTILSSNAGIIDPGTTFIYIATDAYKSYASATNGVHDSATGLLTIDASQYSALRTLSFNIGGHPYDLLPNAQIWPRSLNTVIGGSSNKIYLVISDIGTPSGQGFNFILGFVFLERYYAIFDEINGRIGLATTAYTNATTN